MRELDSKELNIVGGDGDPLTDPNSRIMRQIMAGAAWGATFGVRGGLSGIWLSEWEVVLLRLLFRGRLLRCLLMFRSQKFRWGQHGTVVKVKSFLGYN
ncbi:hypothetical protein BRR55_25080 [Salmonella enterica]|nr:hypothetical protein [Salmonella enterica]